MDIRKLQRAIVDGLEDVKAQNIVVFNTEHLSPLFERVVIASGTSNRQTKALAASVRDAVKKRGMQVMRTEGEDNGEWIIVDCGAAVAHIMQPAIREYYHLEEIWGGKPVKLKLDGEARSLPKASEPEEDEDEAPAAKKAPAKKATAKKVAAKPAKNDDTPAKKVATKKAAAKPAPAKTPARKAGVTRTVGVKSTAGTAAKKTAAKKAPAKTAATKTVVVNAAQKKTAAKAPAKKAAPAKTASAAKKAPARKTAR
jgi:ribosome-associated protein